MSGRRLAGGMFGSVPTALPARNGEPSSVEVSEPPSSGNRRSLGTVDHKVGRRSFAVPGPTTWIDLTAAEHRELEQWVRAGTTAQRLAQRARLILGRAAGLGSRRLAQQEGISRTTVRRWVARFVVHRCTGLKDRPRQGRPTCIGPVTRALTVALACERPAERNVPLSRYSLAEIGRGR